MTRTFCTGSILGVSVFLMACSNTGATQESKKIEVGGRYIVTEEMPFTNQAYIELKPVNSTHGTYLMNPPSQGMYEIKDGKILLYDQDPLHQEKVQLLLTGTVKDGDIYFPLTRGAKDLGICRFRRQTSNSQDNVVVQKPVPPPHPAPPSLDDQAANEIRKKYGTVYAKCGDSYYSKLWAGNYFSYTQHKDVSFTPAPRELNEADGLNGVEWAGTVNVARRFLRESFEQGGQQHWKEYRSVAQGEPQHFRARKVKGKWELDDAFIGLQRIPTKPSCAEIPKD